MTKSILKKTLSMMNLRGTLLLKTLRRTLSLRILERILGIESAILNTEEPKKSKK